jgi:hypothetical protein
LRPASSKNPNFPRYIAPEFLQYLGDNQKRSGLTGSIKTKGTESNEKNEKCIRSIMCSVQRLFLASVFAGEDKTSTHVFRPCSNLVIDAVGRRQS